MKKLALLALLLFAVGCTPARSFVLSIGDKPIVAEKPSAGVLRIIEFNVPEDIKTTFSPGVFFFDIQWDEDPAQSLEDNFVSYLKSSGLFKNVLTRRQSGKADCTMKVNITKVNWEQRVSSIFPALLTILTVDLYYLLGGPIAWPAAEVVCNVEFKQSWGEPLTFEVTGNYGDYLSRYSQESNTPAVQLARAYASTIDKIIERVAGFVKAPEASPVKLAVLSPKDGSTVNRSEIKVRFTASGLAPGNVIKIIHNGKPHRTLLPKKTKFKGSSTIWLKPGKNIIGISAGKSHASLSINYKPLTPKENTFFAAGFSKFQYMKGNFHGADDARALSGNLSTSYGASGPRIGLACDVGVEKMYGEFRSAMSESPANGCLTMFYFGHVFEKRKRVALFASDSRKTSAMSGVTFFDLSRMVSQNFKGKRLLLVIVSYKSIPKLFRNAAKKFVAKHPFANIMLLTQNSSSPRPISGAFTSKGDRSGDGLISFKEFERYIRGSGRLAIYGKMPDDFILAASGKGN